MPVSIIQKHIERLVAKRHNLGTQVKFAISCSTTIITGLKGRFDRNRFIKRLQLAHDLTDKSRQQLISRFSAIFKLKAMQQGNRKDRFKIEKIRQRIVMERKSLSDKMATLRAIDPQKHYNADSPWFTVKMAVSLDRLAIYPKKTPYIHS
jgi:exodeoxyribonuclease VII large subunit